MHMFSIAGLKYIYILLSGEKYFFMSLQRDALCLLPAYALFFEIDAVSSRGHYHGKRFAFGFIRHTAIGKRNYVIYTSSSAIL
jgi:hypothetical protein